MKKSKRKSSLSGNTWIFGDSYGLSRENGWTGYVAHRSDLGQIINRCQGGSGPLDAYFEIMRSLKKKQIVKGDRVVYIVSEKFRSFRNNNDTLRKMTWDCRDSITMTSMLYSVCLRDACAELEKLEIRTLIIWAFPSGWPDEPSPLNARPGTATWDDGFKDIDVADYQYFHGVDHIDQIRPALYYFSIQEIPPKRMVSDGHRPNHIEDQNLHRKLADIVAHWILSQWQGIRDLLPDLDQQPCSIPSRSRNEI